jgi:hypothetical protein
MRLVRSLILSSRNAASFSYDIKKISIILENNVAQILFVKHQQMLKEVVDFLLTRSKFSTPTCFGIWLPSSGVVSAL